mgnify:CR=1 FL=1
MSESLVDYSIIRRDDGELLVLIPETDIENVTGVSVVAEDGSLTIEYVLGQSSQISGLEENVIEAINDKGNLLIGEVNKDVQIVRAYEGLILK